MTFKQLRGAIASLALLAGTAFAGPIVDVGSNYSVWMSGGSSVNTLNAGPVAFDANAAAFTRAGLNLSLTESQTDLGNGKHLIVVSMSADGELFPIVNEVARLGLGAVGSGLSFLHDVYLDTAHVSLFGANGSAYFTSTNLADDYRVKYFSGAWDGFFPSGNAVFAFGNVGGRDTRGFSFTFEVTEIPEPDAAALAGLALLALVVSRRFARRV
jgi:hypothetical protein